MFWQLITCNASSNTNRLSNSLIKKIFIPFDFSALALSALRFAIELAEAGQGEVIALHVVHMTPAYLESLDPNGYSAGSASILSEISREATANFARVKREQNTRTEPGFASNVDCFIKSLSKPFMKPRPIWW